jgi:hypothetical protein
MVIALVLGFVMACASPPELLPTPTDETAAKWNAAVKKHIQDPQRASKMMQYGQQLFDLQKSLSRDIAALDEKGFELNASYTSTRDEARQMVANFMQKRNVALAQYRVLIFAMRREVTAAEWKALND